MKALATQKLEKLKEERLKKSIKNLMQEIGVTPRVDVSTNFERLFRSGQPLVGGKRNFINSFLPPHLRS